MLDAADEKFSTEGDVDAHIAMHGVFAQQVDSKFFPRLSEAHLSIECQHIRENPPAFVVVYEVEKLLCHFETWLLEDTVFRGSVVVVNSCVLVMQCAIQ